jgi:hypothetical protein
VGILAIEEDSAVAHRRASDSDSGAPLVAAQSDTAQRRDVEYRPTCTACAIALEHVATLGRTSDTASPSPGNGDIGRDSSGRFYTWTTDRFQIVSYDADGSLRSIFGRRGSGPGEIPSRGNRLIVSPSGRILAFVAGRYVAFDSAGEPVAMVRLPGMPFGSPLLRPNGDLIMAAPLRAPSAVGKAIHVISPTGELVRSFLGDGTFDIRCVQCLTHRFTAVRGAEQLWVVPPNRYELMRIDLYGRILGGFDVRNSWFSQSTDSMRPNVPITSLRQDRNGLLWIFAAVRPATPRPGRGVAAPSESVLTRIQAATRTVIDVFDPKAGVFVTSRTIGGEYMAFGDEYLMNTRQLPDGNVVVDVFRTILSMGGSEQ